MELFLTLINKVSFNSIHFRRYLRLPIWEGFDFELINLNFDCGGLGF